MSPPRPLARLACAAALFGALSALGCSGRIAGGADDAGAGAMGDAPSPVGDAALDAGLGDASPVGADVAPDDVGTATTAGCAELAPVITVFAQSCASSGACHVPGARFPDLTPGGLGTLLTASSQTQPGARLVVPGDVAASWLHHKVAGTQGPTGGFLMPIGAREPIEGVAAIDAWISAGAPTRCPDPAPEFELPRDPNTLDRDALFRCAAPGASSPARLRRLERLEWTHATGWNLGANAADNPLYAPDGRYSTHAAGVSLDAPTLDLYLTVLPTAANVWSTRSGGQRMLAVYSDASLRCMFDDVTPTPACLDNYVGKLLSVGVLFRTPSADETAQLRAFLVTQLAAEAGDRSLRPTTLRQTAAAAWLSAGALFHAELGEPVPGDPYGRRRLTADELALAVGRVLNTHPPGSSLTQATDRRPGPPDADTPTQGWLGRVRAAARDGTIHDPAVLRGLLATYRGGVDPTRADLAMDVDSRDRPRRGAYWLAPRIAGFFREWLDYGGATSAFKDTPAATSAYEREGSVGPSFANLQHGYYGYESNLTQQLDDTIARAVLDAEAAGGDVFAALLTTRLWRLPSNLSMSSTVSCTSSADCAGVAGGNSRCQGAVGLCSSSSSTNVVSAHRVYGVGDVPATPDGRWVTMPADQRAGVLTHPAWLAAHGGNFEDDASAIHRGKWVRERLLCETVPGLELVMVEAQLVPSAPALRARDRIHQSTEVGEAATQCMGCHRLMNGLGMPFEIYNHAGFLRATDHGQTPTGRSLIEGTPDPSIEGDVADALELSRRLARSGVARRCFVRQAFRYFMGRDETLADACALSAMAAAMERGSFFAMLDALVTSDTFLYRHLEGGAP